MKPITVVLAGSPGWGDAAVRLLADLGCRVVRYGESRGYVSRLVDDHAALVLVDGADPGWRFWTATLKASPATRRIPLIVVSADPARRDAARTAGADFLINPADLESTLPDLIDRHARRRSAADHARLADQCAGPLPPEARQAVELFNAGEYYRQHDVFEALWAAEPGPVRDLYQAILQVGIACYQATRGNQRGALKMVLRSLPWLDALPDTCRGVDVARLRADARRLRDALGVPGSAGRAALDAALPIRVILVEG